MAKKPLVMLPGYSGRIAGDLEFHALRRDWDGYISLLIKHLAPGPIAGRKMAVATQVVFEVVPEEMYDKELEVDPTLKLRIGEAQQLMDQLWQAGCRPSKLADEGEKGAIYQHLDDMRAIVEKSLDINLTQRLTGRLR